MCWAGSQVGLTWGVIGGVGVAAACCLGCSIDQHRHTVAAWWGCAGDACDLQTQEVTVCQGAHSPSLGCTVLQALSPGCRSSCGSAHGRGMRRHTLCCPPCKGPC